MRRFVPDQFKRSRASWKQRYLNYLNSPHWDILRSARLEMDENRCTQCGGTAILQVQHVKYRDPLEDCTVTDVRTLCKKCHMTKHPEKASVKVVLWSDRLRNIEADLRPEQMPALVEIKRFGGQRERSRAGHLLKILIQLQAAKTGVLGRSVPTVGESQGLTKHSSEQGGAAHVNQQKDAIRSPVIPGPVPQRPLATAGSGGEIPRPQATSTIA